VFDDAGVGLVNQWLGVRAVRASVGYGPSWLDGGPSIVVDYAATSRVWRDVRDEVREVAPGLYLGHVPPAAVRPRLQALLRTGGVPDSAR
jgi:hypothetical protein